MGTQREFRLERELSPKCPLRRPSDANGRLLLPASAMNDTAQRLRAALAAVLIKAEAPELALVHHWLDGWRGVGLLAVGLHRAGYDLHLTQYGDGHWRASFYVTGFAHSISRRFSLGAYGVASRSTSRLGRDAACRATLVTDLVPARTFIERESSVCPPPSTHARATRSSVGREITNESRESRRLVR
jgi:hypothetical protein